MVDGSGGQYILAIIWFTGACYAALVMVLALAIGRVRTGTGTEQPFVSVVVAARNEQKAIGHCLDALQHQSYSSELFEVICVNDRSTDRTGVILDEWSDRWDRLRVVTIDVVPPQVSPKKHALTHAIKAARGELILQTDADCAPPPRWIESVVRRFDASVDMVAGVAPYLPEQGSIAGFVRHEYFWNILLSAGSIILGFGTHASGRNLAFRRSVFETIDGYNAHIGVRSGDDTLFMQQVQRRHSGAVVTNPDPAAHVYTAPPESFGSLVRQRIRHMSTGRLFQPVQLAAGTVVYGFHTGLLVVICLSAMIPDLFLPGLGACLFKVAVDAVAFRRVERVFGLVMSWRTFLFNELLMVLYLTVFPVLGAVMPVRWKENS